MKGGGWLFFTGLDNERSFFFYFVDFCCLVIDVCVCSRGGYGHSLLFLVEIEAVFSLQQNTNSSL